MTITKPTLFQMMKSLLQADLRVQRRRLRSGLMSIIVPVIVLLSWKNVPGIPGPFALGSCITIGLMSLGLLGYSTVTAQDRAKGVFQRLRATPAPAWIIMGSRIAAQLITIFVMAVVVILAGYYINNIHIGWAHSVLGVVAALFGGIAFLGLGQILVGLVKSADAVNSAGRFIYIPLAFGGAISSLGILGNTMKTIITWSPYGTTETILQAALQGSNGVDHVWASLLVTVLYAIVFAAIGIYYFQWTGE